MTKPLEQSSDLQSPESFDYSQSERVDLTGTLEQVEGDELGKFDFVKEYKDEQNRNWKLYKCTLKDSCTCENLEKTYNNQFGVHETFLFGRNFCDKNGNIIMDGYRGNWVFDKGETVYLRIPNRDIVDNHPEITMNDVNNLSDSKVKEIFESFDNRSLNSFLGHADKNGDYIMINGKKLYIERCWYGASLNDYSDDGSFEVPDSKHPFLVLMLESDFFFHRDSIVKMGIGEYRGNKFHGIIYSGGHVMRGTYSWDF